MFGTIIALSCHCAEFEILQSCFPVHMGPSPSQAQVVSFLLESLVDCNTVKIHQCLGPSMPPTRACRMEVVCWRQEGKAAHNAHSHQCRPAEVQKTVLFKLLGSRMVPPFCLFSLIELFWWNTAVLHWLVECRAPYSLITLKAAVDHGQSSCGPCLAVQSVFFVRFDVTNLQDCYYPKRSNKVIPSKENSDVKFSGCFTMVAGLPTFRLLRIRQIVEANSCCWPLCLHMQNYT